MPITSPDAPADIGDIFDRFPDVQRRALISTWQVAVDLLPGAEQCIAWQMPSLRVDGDLVLSLLGFQEHNSVFPGAGVIEALGSKLAGLTVTKGTIHFSRDQPMKVNLVKAIITARINEINASFPRSNGTFKEFYPNGWLKAKGKMKSGQLHGQWEWWRRDGTIKRSGRFQEGRQVGTWITYNAAGQPHKETSFD